jgi:hypothetical protein
VPSLTPISIVLINIALSDLLGVKPNHSNPASIWCSVLLPELCEQRSHTLTGCTVIDSGPGYDKHMAVIKANQILKSDTVYDERSTISAELDTAS